MALAFREDLPWLLQAARLAAEPRGARESGPPPRWSRPCSSGARGSWPSWRPPPGECRSDIEEALWDGVARGLLTADGFAAIRSLVGPGEDRDPDRPTR